MRAVETMMALLLFISVMFGITTATVRAESKVSAKRLERLTKGVNLQGWFWGDFDPKGYDAYDMDIIKSLGFRHVRLPIHIDVVFDESHPSVPKSTNLRLLEDAIDMVIRKNLGIIIELHSVGKRGWSDPAYMDKLEQFWQALASKLSKFNPDLLYLEVMNEPVADKPQLWDKAQARYLAAMRKGAPVHTLIASGNCVASSGKWDMIKAFSQLTPVSDSNVVYNFHLYDPFTFTQQGATFGWEMLPYFKKLPYPTDELSEEEKQTLLASIDKVARADAKTYLDAGWNKAKLTQTLAPILEWKRKYNLPVTANEFGVYKPNVPKDSRYNWLRDAREILEENGIGWAMWEYNQGFGLIEWGQPDFEVLKALGLK